MSDRLIRIDVEGSVPKPDFVAAVKRALRRGLHIAEGAAKENANAPSGSHPQVRTGNLRSKIYARLMNSISGVLAAPVEYASALENGATIHQPEIRPKNKKALRFVVGGNVVFAKRVKARTIKIPAYPFLWPALEDNSERIGHEIELDVSKEYSR